MNKNELIEALHRAAKNHPEINGNYAKLAEMAGMNQPTVYRILTGATDDPQIDSVLKIANACGVKITLLGSKVVDLPGRPAPVLDNLLLGLYLDKMDLIFPQYGLNKLTWYQKAALAKIGYDNHVGKKTPDDKTVTAEVIQWAETHRVLSGS